MFQDRMATAEMAYYKAMGMDPPNSTTNQVTHQSRMLVEFQIFFCVQISGTNLEFPSVSRTKYMYSPYTNI